MREEENTTVNTVLCILTFAAGLLLGIPEAVLASAGGQTLDLTAHWVGYAALVIFVVAYLFVMAEEHTHLRKSKPVLLAAGLIWGLIAWVYASHGLNHAAEIAVRHNLLEYGELFLFLLVAMTYINAMEERQVFEALRARLVSAGFSYRKLFWITGLLAFFISPVADNLTTALLMCAVVMAIGKDNAKFVMLSCINIVVGANAGGAFSPFGDITTLMVWQKGIVPFWTFFALFIPAVVNWFVPALIMSFAVPNIQPTACTLDIKMKRGGFVIIGLFLLTICTAVSFHNFLHMPPVIGMMTGLSFLKIFGYYLKKTHKNGHNSSGYDPNKAEEELGDTVAFDVFKNIARAEWDTLMFFYGVILCVGGLGFIGYLAMASQTMYTGWGATPANIMVGVLSAIVDNIPVMFAVLTMKPEMSQGQWLLVTMTAGVGGSMLSIGSAAGVALMGQARGMYTFFGHLKWTPVIALGYAASIYVHFLINGRYFVQ
ncbi:MAG: sodium:proton antiporter NhaD [Proteobacteria bacterium]|nr:sodium:proton antiporter [Desulfocapsa sp.]MBU3943278.1 sodium:proton antiporter NhaD [Pseudomonadota bacterium]MBU4027749.1 sodium:proton antiporter NhaD [Pseudomonadota bacterium]MBU4042828.1 sodium:proton antiporter NhaD [Pseudomonadota bacterium]MBU4083798.1 sodium:proton antiporter NhaD [Pseudomonadota bacterium]